MYIAPWPFSLSFVKSDESFFPRSLLLNFKRHFAPACVFAHSSRERTVCFANIHCSQETEEKTYWQFPSIPCATRKANISFVFLLHCTFIFTWQKRINFDTFSFLQLFGGERKGEEGGKQIMTATKYTKKGRDKNILWVHDFYRHQHA